MRVAPTAAGVAVGLVADTLLGDPARHHPVAGFGAMAGALERRCYADSRQRGTLFAGVAVGSVVGAGLAVDRWSRSGSGRACGSAALATWLVVGQRSLTRAAERVYRALAAGDLEAAREQVPALCGRDAGALDVAGVSRAAVESLAENSCDATVAPVVFALAGALAGCPVAAMLGYRAVNTLDAMVGHRSPRYARFGTAAARADDVANWVPARLTALLAAACAPLVSGSAVAAVTAVRQGARAHPSPNAGWPEAAFAGALAVRLGGALSYAGRVQERPVFAPGAPPAGVGDIPRAMRLSRAVAQAQALGVLAVAGAPLVRRRRSSGAERAVRGSGRDAARQPLLGARGRLA